MLSAKLGTAAWVASVVFRPSGSWAAALRVRDDGADDAYTSAAAASKGADDWAWPGTAWPTSWSATDLLTRRPSASVSPPAPPPRPPRPDPTAPAVSSTVSTSSSVTVSTSSSVTASTSSSLTQAFYTVHPAPTASSTSKSPYSRTDSSSSSLLDSTSASSPFFDMTTQSSTIISFPTTTTATTATTTTGSLTGSDSGSDGAGTSVPGNRTLVITLSTVLSLVALVLVVAAVLICARYRRRGRPSFFSRGITPIGDDEIATWRVGRGNEKAALAAAAAVQRPEPIAVARGSGDRSRHMRQESSVSFAKPASVIVYDNPSQYGPRPSAEFSPRSRHDSHSASYGKTSFDKELPQTPMTARAPNSRVGLTDETVPGDDPFLPSPKRQHSRISKLPPVTSPRHAHTRTRSSRSSLRSFQDYWLGSDVELSPRTSNEHHYTGGYNYSRTGSRHSRKYSSSSIPPRLSLGDEGFVGGLSPRPLFRDEEIGRAIG